MLRASPPSRASDRVLATAPQFISPGRFNLHLGRVREICAFAIAFCADYIDYRLMRASSHTHTFGGSTLPSVSNEFASCVRSGKPCFKICCCQSQQIVFCSTDIFTVQYPKVICLFQGTRTVAGRLRKCNLSDLTDLPL